MPKAQPITIREWIELATLPAVRKAFGFREVPTYEQITEAVYGARFISDSDVTTYTLMGRKGGAVLLETHDGWIKQLNAQP